MLEVNKVLFENNNFMETHDFYDIPGLNEYMKNEKDKKFKNDEIIEKSIEGENNDSEPAPIIEKIEQEKKQKPKEKALEEKYNEDFKYIKGIFKYLKGKIENFIFIISIESCYKPINIEIIKEIRKNIDFDFEGGLFILTKIDLAENKQKKIEECKQYFINNMPSNIFNIYFNDFIALNSIDFKIEMKIKTNIKYYFLYFFKKYYDKFINNLEDNKKANKSNKTLIEFIEEAIKEVVGNDGFDDFIEKASEEFQMNDLNLIKKEYEKIKEKEKKSINFGIDFDDENDDSVNILKGLYKLFTEKKYFPSISENTQDVIKYFNTYKNGNTKGFYEVKKKGKAKIDKSLEKLEEIFKEIKLYIDEDKNDINSFALTINSKLRRIKKYIKNGRNIYIPFIGISSAGKSTILNCLIGYKLFPESDGECTTRGIIVQYGKNVELYEIKIESVNNFYVFEKDRLLSKGVEKVQECLKYLNYEYGKDESKYFYLIETPIKFFDDYIFEESLKKKIFLIDLPGCDTQNNKFNEHNKEERTAYEKLIDISSSFVFINKGRGISTTTNKTLLSQVYNVIDDNNKLGPDYIKNCLFVVNMFESLNKEEKDISDMQKDISSVIFKNEESQNEYKKMIKVSLFDAIAYTEHLKITEKICNKKILFDELKNDFIEKRRKNFTKFCLNKIKTKSKDLSIKIDENFDSNILFYEDIKNEIISIKKSLKIENDNNDSTNIKQISNLLQNMIIKIKENKFYLNSNCDVFFTSLEKQIIDAKQHVEKNFDINLNDCFKYFDLVFKKDIVPEESQKYKSYQNKVNEIIHDMEILEEKYKIEKIFDYFLEKILELFKNIKDNKEELLKKYNNKIEELLEKELKENSQKILENLNKEIEKTMMDLDKEVEKCKTKVIELFLNRLKNEIKAGKYKAEIEILTKFSFVEKIKLNICNLFSKDNSLLLGLNSFNILSAIVISFLNPPFLIINGLLGMALFWKLLKEKRMILEQKLEQIQKDCEINFTRMRIKFSRIYKDTLNQVKDSFRDLLVLSCVDLSKIEKGRWEDLKNIYKKLKDEIKLLLNEE